MIWKLFIDDIRQADRGTVLCRNVDKAVELIDKDGFPTFISFDHDMGINQKSGKDFANIIVERVLNQQWIIPNNFSFQVHSDNPLGAENIRSIMNALLKEKNISFSLKRVEPYSLRDWSKY